MKNYTRVNLYQLKKFYLNAYIYSHNYFEVKIKIIQWCYNSVLHVILWLKIWKRCLLNSIFQSFYMNLYKWSILCLFLSTNLFKKKLSVFLQYTTIFLIFSVVFFKFFSYKTFDSNNLQNINKIIAQVKYEKKFIWM